MGEAAERYRQDRYLRRKVRPAEDVKPECLPEASTGVIPLPRARRGAVHYRPEIGDHAEGVADRDLIGQRDDRCSCSRNYPESLVKRHEGSMSRRSQLPPYSEAPRADGWSLAGAELGTDGLGERVDGRAEGLKPCVGLGGVEGLPGSLPASGTEA